MEKPEGNLDNHPDSSSAALQAIEPETPTKRTSLLHHKCRGSKGSWQNGHK